MLWVINGTTYDTDTAKEIGQVTGNLDTSDAWFHAMLYRVQLEAKFFMVGVSGALGAFNGGVATNGCLVGACEVTPDRALELVHDCLPKSVLLDVFGPWIAAAAK